MTRKFRIQRALLIGLGITALGVGALQASAAAKASVGTVQSYGNLNVRILQSAISSGAHEPLFTPNNAPADPGVVDPPRGAHVLDGAIAEAAPGEHVTPEGPTAGPAGLVIPLVIPACVPRNGDVGIIALYVDHEAFLIIWAKGSSGLTESLQWGFWTINDDVGPHRFSAACYDSGAKSLEGEVFLSPKWEDTSPPQEWKDDGFAFEVTGPSVPTELPVDHAGPGYALVTPSGAPAGSSPCPTIDGKPWRTVRIWFYSPKKQEYLYPEERYPLSDPEVAPLSLLPMEIPPSAETGESIYVTVGCFRPAEVLGAEEVQFTFHTTVVDLDAPPGGALRERELAAGGWNRAEWCVNCLLRRFVSFGYPVDGPTGNFWHSFTDFSIPGRGLPLELTRTYNSMLAETEGPFGHGWSFGYGMSLSFTEASKVVVDQEDGAEVTFTEQPNETFGAAPRVTATLTHDGNGNWTFVRHGQETFVFDGAGRLIEEKDRNGDGVSLAYVGGRLTTVTNSSGRSLSFAYDPEGHISTVTDPMGREVTYAYDAAGDLTDVTDPRGGGTHFTYDASHRLLTMRLPDQEPGSPGATGAVIRNTYDSDGRVIAQTNRLGATTTFAYAGESLGPAGGTTTITDADGNRTVQFYRFGELLTDTHGVGTLEEAEWSFGYDPSTLGMTQITDPEGGTTANTFDAEGNLLTTTNPLGRKTIYTYGSHNDLTSETDPRGSRTTFSYDDAGNLLEKEAPLQGTSEVARTTYSYEGAPGDITAVTDPDGHTMHFSYDAAGDRTSVTDADGNETTYQYDPDGELTSVVTPAGNVPGGTPAAHTSAYTYNAAGELTSATDPLGHTTSYAYDGDGNRTKIIDALSQTTEERYDAEGERTEVVRPGGSILKTEWDPIGDMTAQIDGAGNRTTYAYDALGRLTSATDPDGRTTTYAYDRAGDKVYEEDPEGQSVSYRYDAAHELTGTFYSDGSTSPVVETDDEDGNRIEMSDGRGVSTFAYDSLNRMTSATNAAGETVHYTYDLAGNLMGLTYPNGQTVTRHYDPAGNLTSVTDWLGHTTEFHYDPNANIREELFPNGVSTGFGYDSADQVTSITDSDGTEELASFSYGRDDVGRVARETATNGESAAVTYTRDPLGQLTAADAVPYGYDAADNPTTFGEETTQRFDPAGQLTTITGPFEIPEVSEEPEGEGETEGIPTTPGSSPQAAPAPIAGTGTGSRRASAPSRVPVPAPPVHVSMGAAVKKPGLLISPALRGVHRGDLILALVAAAGSGQRVTKISSNGLRWQPVARTRSGVGAVEIWEARAKADLHKPVAIRLRRPTSRATGLVTAVGSGAVIEGYEASKGRHSVPRSPLNAGQGGLLWGVGLATGQQGPVRPAKGQKVQSSFIDPSGHMGGWVQSSSNERTRLGLSHHMSADAWTLLSVAVTGGSSAAEESRLSSTSPDRGRTDTLEAAPPGRLAASRDPGTASDPLPIVTRAVSYNARGDRTDEEAGGRFVRTLKYDLANRLVGVNSNVSYSYNGNGLRTSKTVNGLTTTFVWNEAESIPELLRGGATYYVYGPGGMPIEQIDGATATFLHEDQEGSVRLLTDPSGAVTGRYEYSPWGAVTSHAGSATSDLQFDGQYTDAETGFQYLRARYYDPATGQFLTPDPLFSATESRFGYADNDPVSGTDPLGLWNFNLCVVVCIAYKTGSGVGTGFGLSAGLQIGAASGGAGGNLIAYPGANEVALSGGAKGLGGEVDFRDGQFSIGQTCIGVGLVGMCEPLDAGSSKTSTYRQPNPLPWLQEAHKQWVDQVQKGSPSAGPCLSVGSK